MLMLALSLKSHYIHFRYILKNTIVCLTIVINCPTFAQSNNGIAFHSLEEKVFRKAYTDLPQLEVSSRNFGKKGNNPQNKLFNAAQRTLTDNRNWLAEASEPKLFNANGICFTGQWIINTPSKYTGLFSQHTQANILARASVSLSGTKQRHKRAFGIAIKVFDTKNSKSANLFVMHSMVGVKTKYVLDLELDNHPKLGGLPPLSKIPTLLRINKDLERADAMTGQNKPIVNYRSVTDLAKINTAMTPVAPTWVKLVSKTSFRVDKDDFRDEISILNYPDKEIEYKLYVDAGDKTKKENATWLELGLLKLKKSVVSRACDINLHFTHPKNDIVK